MAMVIQHNLGAQLALGELNKNVNKVSKLLAKVSSGQKINSAQDDASGYSISEKMREMIRTLNQDHQNVQNGSALFKIAEGGINSIVEELRNLKELAINSANDTNTDVDRLTIQKVFDQKKMNINDIATETNYNGKTLLDGLHLGESGGKVDIVLVVDTTGSMGDVIGKVANNIKLFTDSLTETGSDWRIGLVRFDDINESEQSEKDIGVKSVEFSSGEFTSDEDELVNELKNLVTTLGIGGDGPESGYEGVIKALEYDFRTDATKQVFVISDADVHDADDGDEKGKYTAEDIVRALSERGAAFSMIGHPGTKDWEKVTMPMNGKIYNIEGNYGSQLIENIESLGIGSVSAPYKDFKIHHGSRANQAINFSIYNMHTKYMGAKNLISRGLPTNDEDLARYDALSYDKNLQSDWLETLKSAQNKNLDEIDVITKKNANIAVRVIDGAIEYALNEATRIGSYLQRLDYTDSNLVVMNENVQAAESTIRDADMAKEMTEYTKFNILTQSAQAMLAQANQNSSGVLSLLQ